MFHLHHNPTMWIDNSVLCEMRYHQSYEKDLTWTILREYIILLCNKFLIYLYERRLFIPLTTYKQSS